MLRIAVPVLLASFSSNAYPQSPDVAPVYEVRVKNPDKKRNDEILKNLERVPDIFQGQANKFGGRVVIFDGNLTDNEGMKQYRGQRTKHGLSYDTTGGMYNPKTKEAFVDQNPSWAQIYGTLFAPLEMHEYSHLVNHALGYPSDSRNFKNVLKKIRKGSRSFYGIDLKEREQIWAEAFAKFYYSPESVWHLWKDFPELYEYFYRFEERTAKKLKTTRPR